MKLATKEAVRSYWDAQPCGSKHANARPGTKEFYTQVEAERDRPA